LLLAWIIANASSAMKYKHTLSISISIGILLSVWAMTDKSTSNGQTANGKDAKGLVHDAAIPNFVKHNQGLELASKSQSKEAAAASKTKDDSECDCKSRNVAHPSATPWIFAQLVLPSGANAAYMRYLITDCCGVPTEWHCAKGTDNEDPNSSIFQQDFDFSRDKDMTITTTVNGEVTVQAYVNGKLQTWTSDSKEDGDDGDVTWK
jgi:hypothetical protein